MPSLFWLNLRLGEGSGVTVPSIITLATLFLENTSFESAGVSDAL